jgi:hypothetical protein
VSADALALLPAGVTVRRATAPPAAPLRNAGIVALGVGPARSGAWNAVDVLVEVAGAAALEARVGDALLSATARVALPGGRVRELFEDLPARGETFTARLAGGDDLAADDEARLVLPRRRLLRVALSAALEGVFGPVLDADPAVVRDDAQPDLVVRLAGEALFDHLPAIVLVPEAEQEEAILLVHRAEADSSEVLAGALGELGLDRIDAAGLAQAAARPISAGARPGPVPQVALWRELTDRAQFQFVESRAFPVLVARSLRWLAGVEPILPYAASAEPLVGVAVLEAGGVRLDALGAPLAPPRVGTYTAPGGAALHVSLLADLASAASDGGALEAGEGLGSGDGWDGVTWILLLALALLGLEWQLSRTGRMP